MLPEYTNIPEQNSKNDASPAENCREAKNITVSCKLRLSRERGFYGPGVHQLLLLTQECGSLSQACQTMGMSYSKGRKIIARLEGQLGVPILETRQGGKSGGFSHLTEAAKDFIARYSAFQEEADAAIQEMFRRHFPQE